MEGMDDLKKPYMKAMVGVYGICRIGKIGDNSGNHVYPIC